MGGRVFAHARARADAKQPAPPTFYPVSDAPQLSATIAAEFSTARNRGALVASVFAMQGIGILFAAIVAVCTTAAFKNLILKDVSYLDYVWRIELGLGVVPALLTVYLRKKLPETLQWTIDVAGDVAQAAADADAIGSTRPRAKEADEAAGREFGLAGARSASLSARVRQPAVEPLGKTLESLKSIDELKPSVGASAEKFTTSNDGLGDGGPSSIGLREYLTMPSIAKNRNFSILVGTCMCWFLLSISFFSQNLFLPDVLKRSASRFFLFWCCFFFFFLASLLASGLCPLTFSFKTLASSSTFPAGFARPISIPKGKSGSEGYCAGRCSEEVYATIYRSAVGNALVAAIGTVPGYFVTIAFVDRWGRVPIQYMGFAMMTVLLVILAAAYPQLGDPVTATAKPSEWSCYPFFLPPLSSLFSFSPFSLLPSLTPPPSLARTRLQSSSSSSIRSRSSLPISAPTRPPSSSPPKSSRPSSGRLSTESPPRRAGSAASSACSASAPCSSRPEPERRWSRWPP